MGTALASQTHDIVDDPARLGFPPTLPVEIAMRSMSVRETCEAYGIGRARWDELRADPGFQKAVADAVEMLATDGMNFRVKARLQSEELLKTSWAMIHADNTEVPPTVKANLLMATVKWAGLDGSMEKAADAPRNALQININVG